MHLYSSSARRERQESRVGEEEEILRWNVDNGQKKNFFKVRISVSVENLGY